MFLWMPWLIYFLKIIYVYYPSVETYTHVKYMGLITLESSLILKYILVLKYILIL